VDLPPAERAGPGFQARQESAAQKVPPFLFGASLRLTPTGLTRKSVPDRFFNYASN